MKFRSSFPACGRHFALRDHWKLCKSLHCNEVLHLAEKFLPYSGCCCVQRSPGSVPLTQNLFTLLFPGLSLIFLFIISYSKTVFHYIPVPHFIQLFLKWYASRRVSGFGHPKESCYKYFCTFGTLSHFCDLLGIQC